jgi:hypothetical protein
VTQLTGKTRSPIRRARRTAGFHRRYPSGYADIDRQRARIGSVHPTSVSAESTLKRSADAPWGYLGSASPESLRLASNSEVVNGVRRAKLSSSNSSDAANVGLDSFDDHFRQRDHIRAIP